MSGRDSVVVRAAVLLARFIRYPLDMVFTRPSLLTAKSLMHVPATFIISRQEKEMSAAKQSLRLVVNKWIAARSEETSASRALPTRSRARGVSCALR
jgi:23S rRNA G2445 N2-methylase RlmL